MNVEELSMIGPDVDLGAVDAINKKRLLAFFNHFVINTSLFLNKLSKSCEHGLMSLENKIQKLETSIIILESKLNSVPGLEVKKISEDEIQTTQEEVNNEETKSEDINEKSEKTENEPVDQILDPAYMKYIKMLQFGVPLPAVKLKMEQEGVDSSLHETILNYKKLKGLSTNDSINRRQVINENISVNLNAGTEILDKFQMAWADLHNSSQENAKKAEDVDGLICELHKKVEKQLRDAGQMASCVTSLPEVVHNLGELSKKMLSLEELFDAVETALSQLEDILDTRDFQSRQLEQRFQLALYEEKKLASLENVRLKLAENLAEKLRIHEVKQQKLLREYQIASEENFKEDLRVYKETKMVPKIEFANSESKSNSHSEIKELEDIVLDNGDSSALDEFLSDSKDSEVELPKSEGAVNVISESNVLEDITLGNEEENAASESFNTSEDFQKDE